MVTKNYNRMPKVTFVEDKTKNLYLNVDNHLVHIPVDNKHYAHLTDQFLRPTPTHQLRILMATIRHILRAAYAKGKTDGQNLTA